ncbi:transposase [Lacrimispora amygdalina]|uniref:transposase n=1 Tax=Lacrimispora amygdalina TaxID=253257 RepID=UPI000BE3391F|nr:transposase [Lacrimispora amygdalina]
MLKVSTDHMAIKNVRKRLQKPMPVSPRKYYKRSRKLILTRYKKLKDENKQVCDLMFQYIDNLCLALMKIEWFYDINQLESYSKLQ